MQFRPAGHPLSGLYGSFDAYAGGYSGGRVSNENTALRNAFFNPVTVNANPLPSLFGPINTGYTSPKSSSSSPYTPTVQQLTNFGPMAQSFNPLGTSTSTFRPSKVNVHDLLPTGPTLLDQVDNFVYSTASGLKTGGKAVANSLASSATLGFYDGPARVTQQDIYNGYNTSRLIAGGSSELLVSVATGGASRYAGAVGKTALAIDTTSNALSVGRGGLDVYNNGLGVGNSVQIVGGGLGLGGNITTGGQALREIASDASRLRLDPSVLTQANSGVPLNAIKLAPKVHLNNNEAVGHFGVYELLVNNKLYKVGKAHLDRITQSTGLPTRIHQQIRKLIAQFGDENVKLGRLTDLGTTTTMTCSPKRAPCAMRV